MLVAIAIGGACGAVMRHLMAGAVTRMLGTGFPYGIFAVNILGSFLMGLFVSALVMKYDVSQEWRGLIAVGGLGSFTTFSTYSLEIVMLMERGIWLTAGLYAAGSVVVGVIALMGGMALGKAFI